MRLEDGRHKTENLATITRKRGYGPDSLHFSRGTGMPMDMEEGPAVPTWYNMFVDPIFQCYIWKKAKTSNVLSATDGDSSW
jgi:hypothetical protein